MNLKTGLLGLLCLTAAVTAHAESWPTRPIRIFIPSAPGSPPDVMARPIADKLGKMWKQSVVVENKPGASGIIGMTAFKQAPDEEYAFALVQAAVIAITPHLFKDPQFNVEADMVPVALIGKGPMIIVANNNFAANTVADFFQQAKKAGTPINVAVNGQYSVPYLAAEIVKKAGSLNLNIVPFGSSAAALSAVINGDAQILLDGVPGVQPMVNAKRVKPLAVTSAARLDSTPDIPALAELVPGLEINGWFVLFARKGTSQAVIERVNRDVNTVIGQTDIVTRMADLGVVPQALSLAQVKDFIADETQKWGSVLKTADIPLR